MYLTFVPFYWDHLRDEPSLEKAATKIVIKNSASVPERHRQAPEAAARWLLFTQNALEAESFYLNTFSSLARDFGVYIAAGSIGLPPMESEPSKGGRHVADDTKLYNTSYLFSSQGVCLNRVSKVNLTAGFEQRLFDGAPRSGLLPVDTALGRQHPHLLRRLPRNPGRAL